MALYAYQEKVDTLLRSGRNIILQAPTGAGKTRAALFSFLDGWRNDPAAFPRQCIYAVPMRVLANQFEFEYKATVKRYTDSHGLREVGTVAIQTGARPDDRKLEADLIFTTIDQVLSSFLTIPYSLSNRQANLNAGAIIGSYLVFDEFHLFPVDENGNGALATTLAMLHMLKGVAPFVLMTATFSKTMLRRLGDLLDAEPVVLTQNEIDAIPSQQGKQRRYRYTAQELTPEAIIDDVTRQQRTRVLVVCNTVQRAQDLAQALRTDARLTGVQVELLHSRFYACHRSNKEEEIRREFGEDKTAYTWGPTILVATQVIEVGLNITCQVLHTELAPAAAIVQRAGRCARFAHEAGDVLVYDVPRREDGSFDFAPYLDPRPGKDADEHVTEGPSKICERTQVAFAGLPSDGAVLNYHAELDLVNAAHAPFDTQLLDTLQTNRQTLRRALEDLLENQNRSRARELIRDIDSRTVIVHPNPNEETLPNPYRYEGIGIRRNTLLGWYSRVQEQAMELELDWIVQIAVSQAADADEDSEEPEQRRRSETHWLACRPSTIKADIRAATKDIASAGLVVVNPALVQYDEALGLRFASGTPAPESPLASKRRKDDDFGPIYRETYAEHITGLHRVYTTTLRARTAAVQRRLEVQYSLEPGLLDRAIRLMFAVHDLGKLDRRWQEWAHRWQDRVSVLRSDASLRIAEAYMAAHTDYDSKTEWAENNKIRPRKPPHAAESARAGKSLINALAGDCDALYVAMMTAIVCHHSARLRYNHGDFTPVATHARTAFNQAMKCVDLLNDPRLRASQAKVDWQGFPAAEGLSDDIIRVDRRDQVILYLLLARVLRLADQGSQEQ